MIVEYERTEQDLVEFNLFHISNSKSIQVRLLLTRIFGALFVILLPVLILSTTLPLIENFNSYIIFFLGGVLFFIGLPYYYRMSFIRNTRRLLKEGNNKSLLGKQSIHLSSEGILLKMQNSEVNMSWASIERIAQNEKYIFMYTGAINAYIVPIKAFNSVDEKNQFLDYINKHVVQEGDK